MKENKLKHLEFIQNVITRMNTNSFLLKGWSVTLTSAIFALAAKDANHAYVIITYLPLAMFWFLDGFFLSQEKQYGSLYAKVASCDEEQIDFSMNASAYNKGRQMWWPCIWSKTLFPFYGILLLVTVIVMFAMPQNSVTHFQNGTSH